MNTKRRKQTDVQISRAVRDVKIFKRAQILSLGNHFALNGSLNDFYRNDDNHKNKDRTKNKDLPKALFCHLAT